MEKYTMFMDRQNQYSENEYTTQSNLQIQCNPCQATSHIFTELEQIISRFVWKYKNPRIAKAILFSLLNTTLAVYILRLSYFSVAPFSL